MLKCSLKSAFPLSFVISRLHLWTQTIELHNVSELHCIRTVKATQWGYSLSFWTCCFTWKPTLQWWLNMSKCQVTPLSPFHSIFKCQAEIFFCICYSDHHPFFVFFSMCSVGMIGMSRLCKFKRLISCDLLICKHFMSQSLAMEF